MRNRELVVPWSIAPRKTLDLSDEAIAVDFALKKELEFVGSE